MPAAPLRRTLIAALSSSLAAAVATAACDVGLAAARSADPVGARPLALALAAALALYGVAAIAAGLAVGVVAGAMRATLPDGALGAWRRSLGDPERDRAHAGAILAAAAAAGVEAALVFVFSRRFALEMASKRNAALSTALVAAAALPVAALAWFPLYRALRRAAAALPRPRALSALAAIALVVALGAAAAVASVEWRVIDFGPFYALATFALCAAAHALLLRRGRGAAWWARVAGRGARLVPLAGSALVLVSLLITARQFARDPRAVALIAEETSGARPLLHLARRLGDRDGDGFSSILGGGDCNDRDARIHPGADDEPGNGVDEDCSGADAQRPVAREKEKPAASAAAERFRWNGNLVVITIDTLRADRVNERVMPHLAAFARGATSFSNAYAQAPNTPRSFPSFLTSRFPSGIKWQRQYANFSGITDQNTTFFEVLHQAGMHTAGEFSHFYLTRENGVAQGFDEWNDAGAQNVHDSNTDVAAPRIVPRVVAKLAELAAKKQRFALWTHLFEPHSSYMEHPEFPVHEGGLRGLEKKYDAECSYTDAWLQKILDALKADGLEDDTAVVVFADHGESFGEHRFGGERMYFHGETLYDEVLRVPLLIRLPGQPGRTVASRVMLIDLGPTLVDLVKAKAPPTFQGRSLLPALLGDPIADRPAYAELLPAPAWAHAARALLDGQKKLLYKITENSLELYDLKEDPGEQHNLALRDAAAAAALKRELEAWMSAGRG